MSRSLFLTLTSIVAAAVGGLALFAPATLLVDVKHADPNAAAEVMARTVGVLLLLPVALLGFLVRHHPPSPTLRAVFVANLVLQLGIFPIDILAWNAGAFHGLGSFLPNSVLHVLLATGFGYHLWRMGPPSDREQGLDAQLGVLDTDRREGRDERPTAPQAEHGRRGHPVG